MGVARLVGKDGTRPGADTGDRDAGYGADICVHAAEDHRVARCTAARADRAGATNDDGGRAAEHNDLATLRSGTVCRRATVKTLASPVPGAASGQGRDRAGGTQTRHGSTRQCGAVG